MLFIHFKYRNQCSIEATFSSIKRHSRWWWCWWCWCWWCVCPVLFAAVVVKSLQALSEAACTPSACLTLSEGKCWLNGGRCLGGTIQHLPCRWLQHTANHQPQLRGQRPEKIIFHVPDGHSGTQTSHWADRPGRPTRIHQREGPKCEAQTSAFTAPVECMRSD